MAFKRLPVLFLLLIALPLSAADCPLAFFDAVRYGMTGDAWDIVAADFDGDGAPDLATMANVGRKIEVLLNRPPGFVHGPITTLPPTRRSCSPGATPTTTASATSSPSVRPRSPSPRPIRAARSGSRRRPLPALRCSKWRRRPT